MELHEGLVEKVEVQFWINRESVQKISDPVLGGFQGLRLGVISSFAVLACILSFGDARGMGVGEDEFDDGCDFLHFIVTHSQGGQGRGPESESAGVPGPIRIEW